MVDLNNLALPDREREKFALDSNSNVAVRTLSETLGILINKNYDSIAVTYPTTSSETYTFKTGGLSGTTVYTLTVTYTDSTKTVLSSVVRA
jgi:hypothetical protein